MGPDYTPLYPAPPLSAPLPPFDLPPQQAEPELCRAIIRAHPNAQRLTWQRAYPDPTYSQKKGEAATSAGRAKWQWVTQAGMDAYLAIVEGSREARHYFPEGDIKVGDIAVTFMPDEFDLSDHDIVIPKGRFDFGQASLPDTVVFTAKQILIRGGVGTTGGGTVSSSGLNVTGVGTAFTSLFSPGSIIQAAKQSFVVASVADDTHLTLAGSAGAFPAWNGNAYSAQVERVQETPAAFIKDIRDANGIVYTPGTDFSLAADLETVVWHSSTRTPSPGTSYAITYAYTPRYIVQEDLGEFRHVVWGQGLATTVLARLMPAETHTS